MNIILKAGWGYYEEYNGNPTGSFVRPSIDVEATLIEYQGRNVLVRLANGNCALCCRRGVETS